MGEDKFVAVQQQHKTKYILSNLGSNGKKSMDETDGAAMIDVREHCRDIFIIISQQIQPNGIEVTCKKGTNNHSIVVPN
eukprot:m.41150 g.41150  ORF g.41150 m.41150 type:complete len:79 (-) comp10404_c0_seq4:153-389(-)